MAKKVLGVLAGYVVMAAFVFITFSATYMVLGTEESFQPNSYEVSSFWIIASILLGFAGAVLGGLTSIVIGRSPKASMVLAGLVLVLGVVSALATFSPDEGQSLGRAGEVGLIEAMQSAHQPPWLAFLNPLLGVAGVLFGPRMKRSSNL